ncbi:BON domain-containing protein [Derxia lacustris]|uniref:BON domain-containing protein n=1 Tax=Derxia lacustris TaxID=764842 RepID=UPI000A16EF91|nr:BON domain-containing protein [Derxia lacustris]
MQANNLIARGLIVAILGTGAVFASGCASSPNSASFGETVDDSVITTKVKSAFVQDKTVDATDISVETYKGTVQLSGFAKSQAEIDQAAMLARQVKGVVSVKNDVRLRTAASK